MAYSLRSRRTTLSSSYSLENEPPLSLPVRKRQQKATTVTSPSKREGRVLVDKNNSSSQRQLKLDFPVRKRRQESIPISKVTSPSKRDKNRDITPPIKPLIKSSQPSNFSTTLEKVKSAFHSNPPDQIICREKEIDSLQSFLLRHINDTVPGSLYISGPPGTGKTATLMYLLNRHKKILGDTDIVIINCMSLDTPQSIYGKIALELGLRKNTNEKKLIEHVTSTQSMILLVLDEVDQCSQQVLYKLFEWPSLTGSRVILIGIANSLDLTDRVLPRLKARPQTTPELLIFPPYSKEDIFHILHGRLDTIPDSSSVMDSLALQFCARKVSAINGDIRQALDISRRAVEMSSMTDKCSEPCVKIRDVMHVIDEVCGGAVNKSVAEKMPLQQKLVICSLILAIQSSTCKSSKDIQLGKLYSGYAQICQKEKLRHESQRDFKSLLDMLEAQGVVSIKKAKEISLYKVNLKHDEGQLKVLLSDQTLISSVLEKDL